MSRQQNTYIHTVYICKYPSSHCLYDDTNRPPPPNTPPLLDPCPVTIIFFRLCHFQGGSFLHSYSYPRHTDQTEFRCVLFVYCVQQQQQSLFVAACQSGRPVVMKDTWTFPSISHLLQSIIQQDSQLKMRESGQGLAPRRPPLDNSLRE